MASVTTRFEAISKRNFSRILYDIDLANKVLKDYKLFDYNGNFFQIPKGCENHMNYKSVNLFGSTILHGAEITTELIDMFNEMLARRDSPDPNPSLFPEEYFTACIEELHKVKAVTPYHLYLVKVQNLLDFSIIGSLPIRIMELLVTEGAKLCQIHIQYIVQKSISKEFLINPRDMSIAEYLIMNGLRYNNLILLDREFLGLPVTGSKKTISVMEYIKQCDHVYARIYFDMLLRS